MDQSHRFPDIPPASRRNPSKGKGAFEASRSWIAVIDFLGACKPLNLIVGMCGIIEVVAIAGHLVTGR